MTHTIDPLNTLRPLREDEIAQRGARESPASTSPLAYDVYRSGDQLIIEFDAPGVSPSDITVSVEGRAVEVRVRRSLSRGSGVDIIEAGREHGVFRQRLWLGDRWNLDRLQAVAELGVLTLRAPLAADLASRRIEVTHRRGTSRGSSPTIEDRSTHASQSTVADQWSEGAEVAEDHAAVTADHSAA